MTNRPVTPDTSEALSPEAMQIEQIAKRVDAWYGGSHVGSAQLAADVSALLDILTRRPVVPELTPEEWEYVLETFTHQRHRNKDFDWCYDTYEKAVQLFRHCARSRTQIKETQE